MRVILVRPLHDANIGAVCRAMKNFGAKELVLVSPKAKLGFDAELYAKHSLDVLAGAKTVKTLAEAVKGCDLVVGTTGAPSRFRDKEFRNCVSLPKLPEKLAGAKKPAIVFGSEDSGLTAGESSECGFFVTIPANPEHPVLNLSHAVAVVLCELYRSKAKPAYALAPRREVKQLSEFFGEAVDKCRRVRDKPKVKKAFTRALNRASLSKEEAAALLVAFAELAKRHK
ncbi:MAG: TrmJ/YjtD family RNA methyltransferase [Candidatus Micrarchaeota archaeon]